MKGCILIVEDDYELRYLLEQILIAHDYKVLTAEDVDSAFSIMDAGIFPDIIISDIMMPGKSGFEFLQEVKLRYSNFDIPFIFLSAKVEEHQVREGMNLGADDYLKKPFKTADIIKSVEQRLKKKKLAFDKLTSFRNSLSLNIPHELRTPLVPIIGYSDMIIENADSYSIGDINNLAKNIRSQGLKLKARINKLIQYEELEVLSVSHKYNDKAQMLLGNSSGDIHDYLYQVANIFDRCNDLLLDFEPSIVLITPEHLSILLKELVENSFKFSNPGSKIEVSGRITNSGYLISIQDYGPGIDQVFIEEISNINKAKGDIRSRKFNGFGLLIVQVILRIYNSDLEIISSQETGTTIKILLNVINYEEN